MKMHQVAEALEYSYAVNDPILIWGPPGIGKSSLCHQFAAKKGLTLIDWRLTELESVDMRGTPRERNGFTYWAPPEELPLEGCKKVPDEGILLLDELPQAKPDVKNVAARLVLERRIGEARLKKGWRIFAAGNRLGDAAGTSSMPTFLNNRFFHVDAEADITDWINNYAEPNNVDAYVVAYLRYCAAALLDFNPRSKEAAFASPRSWVALSKKLGALGDKVATMEAPLFGEYCSGHVGRARGNEFASFRRTAATLVSIEQIKLDPTHAPLAKEPSICYALATSLAAQIDRGSIDAAFTYMNRIGKEFSFIFAKKVEIVQPALRKTKAWTNFCALNADYI